MSDFPGCQNMDPDIKDASHPTGEIANWGKHGKDFEVVISEFLLKRLLYSSLKNFRFTREKRGVGKFDDVVMICEEFGNEKEILLAQLKHVQNEEKKVNYELLVEKMNGQFSLPKYYEYYLDSLKTIRDDKDFDGARLKRLFLCTNIGLGDYLGEGISKKEINNDGLFKGTGGLFQLKVSKDAKREIFWQNYLSTRKKLASELVHYLMLEKHIDIISMQKDEKTSLLKDYHAVLAKDVIDVQKRKLKQEFLDNPANGELKEFQDCLYEALSCFHKKYESLKKEELERILDINSSKAQALKKRLQDYGKHSPKDFLEKQEIDIKKSFGVRDVQSQTSLPPKESISENEVNNKIDEFLNLLVLVTNLREVQKITENELPSDLYIKFSEVFTKWFNYGAKEEEGTLKREWLSKDELVEKAKNSHVIFQGKKLELKRFEFVGEENLLTSDLLMYVFCSQNICVGRPTEKTTMSHYYISRNLSRLGADRKRETFTEKDLCERDLSVIVGKPGIGKTGCMQNIAKELAAEKNGEPVWIINAVLNTCQEVLRKVENFENFEDIFRFFAHAEKCKDDFSKNILRGFLKRKSKMKILLDGVDELAKNEQPKVIYLVEALKRNNYVEQIWITTRTHLKEKLEQGLKESSLSLEEMSKEDQVNMLVKYWKHASKQKDEKKLAHFAEKLVENVNVSIDEDGQSFLGIPLQAYMIGCNILEEVEKEDPEIPNILLTLASFYEKFYDEKCFICLQKLGLKEDNYWFKESFVKCWDKYYQHAALLYGRVLYMPEDEKHLFGLSQVLSEDEKESLIRIGILYKKEEDIQFMHRTFAEYFVARFFLEAVKGKDFCRRRKCIGIINEELSSKPLSHRRKFLRSLFDLKVAEDAPLHLAVLNGKKENVEQLNEEEINAKDCLGRTLLYYASQYERNDILEILFQKKIYVDSEDRFYRSYWLNPTYLEKERGGKWSFDFGRWDKIAFSSLATRIKVAQYVSTTCLQDDNNSDILEMAKDIIQTAEETLQILNVRKFNEADPSPLPRAIKELSLYFQSGSRNGKENPLIEAHLYFARNGNSLLNMKKTELRELLASSDFQKHADALRKWPKTSSQITRNLIGFVLKFDISNKKLSVISDEMRKRASNLFLIIENLIMQKVPISVSQQREAFDDDFYQCMRTELSFAGDICKPFKVLKKRVDEKEITGRGAEMIKDVWGVRQNHNFDLDTPFIKAIESIKNELVDSVVEACRLLNLLSVLRRAIKDGKNSDVTFVIERAEERGWLKLILSAVDVSGNTAKELAQKRLLADSQNDDTSSILDELSAAWERASVAERKMNCITNDVLPCL